MTDVSVTPPPKPGRSAGDGLNGNDRAHPYIKMLRDIRVAQGLSLQALGKRIGYDAGTLAHWEQGKYAPGLLKFLDWCDALGVRVTVTPEA